MPRRGLCQCGTVLQFTAGPDGYKQRWPSCGAVVRLRSDSANRADGQHRRQRSGVLAAHPPVPSDPETPYPETPHVAAEQYNYDALHPGELPVVELVALSELTPAPSFWRRWWLPLIVLIVAAIATGLAIVFPRG